VAGYVSAKLDMAALFREIDWNVMWGFVIKKTIPLFWVPAHTITFLLPAYLQVLFAAMLGGVLGVILSLAAQAPRRDMDLAGQAS
jgi:ABC-type phosphate/phosphonate transport system permease subunit